MLAPFSDEAKIRRLDCRKYAVYRQMSPSNCRRSGEATRLFGRGLRPLLLLSGLLAFALAVGSGATSQTRSKKNVLILNEVGLSHSLTDRMSQLIVSGVQDATGRDVEFFSESLDVLTLPGRPSLTETRDWLAKKYGHSELEVVVAVGPDTIKFLADYADTIFPDVPIVICGSAEDQAGNPRLDSRFTGTWQKREPGKTLDAALLLFPDTRHVFVVGGSSVYDQVVMTATRKFFSSVQIKAEISYLTDMEMKELLEQLKNLPTHSIVFYTSYFQDPDGHKFLNATQALPMVASAANAPVFGMSDTYLGNGIVGGDVMNFQQQGNVTAVIVSELFRGKRAEDIPIENLASTFMFDWKEMKRWNIPDSRLPAGSIILFREPSVWEQTKRFWALTLLIVVAVAALGLYLLISQRELKSAKLKEIHLSSQLINAEEQERRRIAAELHDDFSQRLAVLSLGLENVEEATPASFPDVHERLHNLIKSTSELSVDLHTLSHRLHSSTLESLGLVPAVAALCKEFTANQGVRIDFTSNDIPRSVHPDTALCVFRIVQEGLRNLKKHSGASEAKVDLRMAGERLELTVRDDGYGFDLKGMRMGEGLGVRSMEERARSLGGKFEILSSLGKGTTLRAWLPVKVDIGLVKN